MIEIIKKSISNYWNEQLLAPTKPLKLLIKTIREGGHTVETVFEFTDDRGRTTKHGFRTLIQPDMDIVDFIPNIPQYFRNTAWMELCNEHYTIHLERIKEFEHKILGQEILASKLIDGTLVVTNLYPFYDAVTGLTWQDAMLSTSSIIVSLGFRKYGKKYIISKLGENAVPIFKFVNKVYGFFYRKKNISRL